MVGARTVTLRRDIGFACVAEWVGGAICVADIFISYTASDRDWAFWIAKELEALGHLSHVHEWEIKGGDDIYAWMQERHQAADHVLCVVSEDYLNAPYSTLERNAALWQAVSKRPGFVLLVAVKPCRMPTLSDHIRRCELFGVPEDAARVRFREFIQKRKAPEMVPFPGKVFAAANIPIRVPEHFMGRDDLFPAIDSAFARCEGSIAVAALHGMRGVGKTTAAAAYAERHRADYRATWWIRAQADITMRADLVALGIRLGWVGPDDKEEPALAKVMERLRHEGEGILLIYDNAVDARATEPCLPRGGAARVLVTSNAPAWRGVAVAIEIQLWPRNTGADYLLVRTARRDQREAAEALTEDLGGLPLAHEQAAAYCERLGVSLTEYAKRLKAAPARLLGEARYAPYAYGLTVAKTFALAIEESGKIHPAAEPLIVHAAQLAPSPIPLVLFAEAAEKFADPLAAAIADDGLDEVVAALRDFALVSLEVLPCDRDPSSTSTVIRLHRLVREIALQRCDGSVREASRRALVAALGKTYPSAYNKPILWPRCALLTPHVLALCEPDSATSKDGRQIAHLLDRAGGYLAGGGAYTGAQTLFEQALAIRETLLGPQHLATAESLSHLGNLLRDKGDLAAARGLHERALAIREKARGSDHRVISESLSSLALVLYREGSFAAAQPLCERALTIREQLLGADHPATARSLNLLARILGAQGNVAEAQPLCERALAIHVKHFGPEDPETVMDLENLAFLLRARGDLVRARALCERALATYEKVLGAEHPRTATSLTNLALLLTDQGDSAAARSLYERALAIRESVLGSHHPDTVATRDNLARLGSSEVPP